MKETRQLLHRCNSDGLLQTEALAARLALLLVKGDCLTLEGDLGAGKTAFARALIAALSEDTVEVTSPTFTLVQSYPVLLAGARSICFHADLYRIEHPAELVELGLEEAMEQGFLLIEWPQIAEDTLPVGRLHIVIAAEEGEQRSFSFYGDDSWKMRLQGLTL